MAKTLAPSAKRDKQKAGKSFKDLRKHVSEKTSNDKAEGHDEDKHYLSTSVTAGQVTWLSRS